VVIFLVNQIFTTWLYPSMTNELPEYLLVALSMYD